MRIHLVLLVLSPQAATKKRLKPKPRRPQRQREQQRLADQKKMNRFCFDHFLKQKCQRLAVSEED